MTFILVHGSWHNGAAWHKVVAILRGKGATVFAPTLSGMESRENPGGPEVDLNTHIEDIVQLIESENLVDVVLVGHSYSGLVITGAADLLPERVRKLVFLDAFIPENNQSLFDIMGSDAEAEMRAGLVDAQGRSRDDGANEVWLLPPGDPAFYLGEGADEADVAWLRKRLVYKPVKTFSEKLHLTQPDVAQAIPAVFIRCTQFDYLAAYEAKARQLGWPVYEIESGHDAMITAPGALAEILMKV